MNINIKTIPHSDHRYPTCGDYWFEENGTLEIRVSDVGDWRYEALVALHELVEVLQTEHKGIREQDIMAFDKMFEQECAEGKHGSDDEPGADPRAPYRKEHFFAEAIERLVSQRLDVDWEEYDKSLMDVWRPKPTQPIQPS